MIGIIVLVTIAFISVTYYKIKCFTTEDSESDDDSMPDLIHISELNNPKND